MTGQILRLLFLLVLFTAGKAYGQYDPHPADVDYRETYRGQYHFSPKSGWMNDINGLLYHDGKYHMIYQWGKAVRHGGYAVSHDLLHWEDRGVALIPQHSDLPEEATRNVSGNHVFSGSAVLVSGQTAMRITGNRDTAMIAVYTGTGEGTCLAWSNDNGDTWHDYPGNPVANPTDGMDPRDPCVFRYAPAGKWVLALYQNGTTFYSSKDLVNWTYLSNIDFGFECPDVYQLPLNGNTNRMKWVLQDANGSYLVGEFDGTRFIADTAQGVQVMDVGPDFYAAQTFPRGNLPGNDPRIIQLAWMDHWNGGIGEEGWERNATFPVSLGLVDTDGGMKITRNPIREIASIYTNSITMEELTLLPGEDLPEDLSSKKFELLLDIDLLESDALTFGVKVANRYIIYDACNHTLLSKPLPPGTDGHVKIRLLVDWGQLEVFANDGVFSYTQQFAFAPEDRSVEIFTDGPLKIDKLEFHEIARTW